MRVKTIRGGKGLGDALYVQSVCRHLCEKGERLKAATSWPDVFLPLRERYGLETMDFTRQGIDIIAHYSMRKNYPTRQWQDVCIQAGIREPVDLRLDWPHKPMQGKPARQVLAVQLPRAPMDRKDGIGMSLLPELNVVQRLIDIARDKGAFVIQIGAGRPLYEFTGIDMDLANKTSVVELLDIATEVDAFLGYVSFIVPLAESLNKRSLCVWSARGLKDPVNYVRQIKPEKVLEKPTSRWVMDSANERQLADAMNELL